MKRVYDTEIFAWENMPEPSYWEGMKFYHRPARRSYRMNQTASGMEDDLLRIDCMCEVHLLKKAHYMRRHAKFLSIEYVQQGSLFVRQRGNMYELEQREVFLMQPEMENEFLSGDSGCKKISFMITGKLLNSFLEESGLARLDVVTRLDQSRMEHLFREISELRDKNAANISGENSRLTFELLQSLRRPPESREIPPAMAALHEALTCRPGDDWNQEKMAEICKCTPTHMVRLFHRYFNTTPWQHLLELRMLHARHLLSDESLSIKEIAAAAGYNNALNFSTGFRKKFGVSPRQYRKQLLFLS